MTELTDRLRQELDSHPDEPLELIDLQTNKTYVLMRKEMYDRLKSILDDEGPDVGQVGALIERNMQEYDAGDPLLAGYQSDSEAPNAPR